MTRRKTGRRMNAKGRNETEQYAKIPYAMIRSAAFRSLNGSALKVWFEIRCRYHGANNGNLHLSMDEAARLLGIGKATVQRAFVELEEKGFLKRVKRGQWYGRIASCYAITDKPHNGNLATNEWRDWKPPGTR